MAWGNAFYALRRYDDALQKYRDSLAKSPAYCPAIIGRGLVYFYRRHGSQVLAELKRAEVDFGSPCGESNKFAQSNLCSTLIREWRNAPRLNPESPLLERAKEHCATALKIDPRFVRPAVATGYILYRQGHFAEAMKHYDQISQQYPTDSGLFANYGFLLYREYIRSHNPGLLKQATENMQKSWDLNSDNSGVADNLGAFHYEQQHYSEAVDFWKKAVSLDGNDPDIRAGLALGLDKTNDSTDAIMSFLQAVKLDSDYCRPELLKQERDWSDQAAADLTSLIAKLPAELNGQPLQSPCADKK